MQVENVWKSGVLLLRSFTLVGHSVDGRRPTSSNRLTPLARKTIWKRTVDGVQAVIVDVKGPLLRSRSSELVLQRRYAITNF